MNISPRDLLAVGPIPRRLAPDLESLVELIDALREGVLGASGVYDIFFEAVDDAA